MATHQVPAKHSKVGRSQPTSLGLFLCQVSLFLLIYSIPNNVLCLRTCYLAQLGFFALIASVSSSCVLLFFSSLAYTNIVAHHFHPRHAAATTRHDDPENKGPTHHGNSRPHISGGGQDTQRGTRPWLVIKVVKSAFVGFPTTSLADAIGPLIITISLGAKAHITSHRLHKQKQKQPWA